VGLSKTKDMRPKAGSDEHNKFVDINFFGIYTSSTVGLVRDVSSFVRRQIQNSSIKPADTWFSFCAATSIVRRQIQNCSSTCGYEVIFGHSFSSYVVSDTLPS